MHHFLSRKLPSIRMLSRDVTQSLRSTRSESHLWELNIPIASYTLLVIWSLIFRLWFNSEGVSYRMICKVEFLLQDCLFVKELSVLEMQAYEENFEIIWCLSCNNSNSQLCRSGHGFGMVMWRQSLLLDFANLQTSSTIGNAWWCQMEEQ